MINDSQLLYIEMSTSISSSQASWEEMLIEDEKNHNAMIDKFFNNNGSNGTNVHMGKDCWIDIDYNNNSSNDNSNNDNSNNDNDTTCDTMSSDNNNGNISPNSHGSRYSRSPSYKNYVTLFPSISLVTQKGCSDQEEPPNRIVKTGRRLLNPPQSPGGQFADSKAITKSSQGSLTSSQGSLLSSDDVKSLSSVIHLQRSQSLESRLSSYSNHRLTLSLHLPDDSSMYCHADSKEFLDNRIECNRIESMDSIHSYASSNDDALNSSCSSFLGNSIDWQTQSPVTVSRADAVMALIQEELYQGQSILFQKSRSRSVSAPSIYENEKVQLYKNHSSSSSSSSSSSPPVLSRSKTVNDVLSPVSTIRLCDISEKKKSNEYKSNLDGIPEHSLESAYSTLDRRKIKAINDMKNFVTRSIR